MSDNKKKHHVVPATYLAGFVDSIGKLYEYRKDDPENPRYNIPKEVGHRRYYYSQPMPDGGMDHNTLENFFDRELESKWNDLLLKIRNKNPLSQNDHELLFQFVSVLRVRVPAARDAVELQKAEIIKTAAKLLDSMGQLPPKPEELENIDFIEDMQVSIDPHQSIHAMPTMINGFGLVLDAIGFKIFENGTSIPFITSDNPVANFDPDIPERKMLPYVICRDRMRIELIFPIDNKHVLHGHSDYRKSYVDGGITYAKLEQRSCIKRFNRLICKFGYEKLFACSTEHEALIKKYSSLSPVLRIDRIAVEEGHFNLSTSVFGKRSKLPKWLPKD
jgi:Protein of unknown function (DUF4238)